MRKILTQINLILFLTNLFIFTYKFLIKFLNRRFPPFQNPNYFFKELLSPEPYEIPLYLGLSFIWVIIICVLNKINYNNQETRNKQYSNSRNSISKLFNGLRIGNWDLFGKLDGWKLEILVFLFLLVIFLINIGSYPLKDDIQFIQSPVDAISSFFILFSYLILIALIVLTIRSFNKAGIVIFLFILAVIALFTFEPGFPSTPHDVSYFLGPIYEISQGKTIYTNTSSQYGFLSILFLGYLHQLRIFNPFYLPVFTWILYILQYFLSFWIIYKAGRSIIFGLLGLFSILTLNYFSLFHWPNSFPQVGPMRWLPLIIALFLVQKYKNITGLKLISIFSLLSLWNIEAGIALIITYGFTLFLLTLTGMIDLKKSIKAFCMLIFSIIFILFTLNLFLFLTGKSLIDYGSAFSRLRDFAVSGVAMLPVPWRTHFWFVLLVYFANIIYFFKNISQNGWQSGKGSRQRGEFFQISSGSSTDGNEPTDRIHFEKVVFLFSANLSLFAGIYYIGRSHPHNLFHISLFFLLNTFIFIGLINNGFVKISQNKRLSFIFYVLFFIFFIVYPAYNRKQALASMINAKFNGFKKADIFKPVLEKQVGRYYFFESILIKENLPEDEILILSVDDTYLFYLVNKKNMFLDNPQSGISFVSNKELNRAMEKVLKSCPQKIAASCTLFGCPEYPKINHEAIDIQKVILEFLQQSCGIKYKPVKCTNKLCISSSI